MPNTKDENARIAKLQKVVEKLKAGEDVTLDGTFFNTLAPSDYIKKQEFNERKIEFYKLVAQHLGKEEVEAILKKHLAQEASAMNKNTFVRSNPLVAGLLDVYLKERYTEIDGFDDKSKDARDAIGEEFLKKLLPDPNDIANVAYKEFRQDENSVVNMLNVTVHITTAKGPAKAEALGENNRSAADIATFMVTGGKTTEKAKPTLKQQGQEAWQQFKKSDFAKRFAKKEKKPIAVDISGPTNVKKTRGLTLDEAKQITENLGKFHDRGELLKAYEKYASALINGASGKEINEAWGKFHEQLHKDVKSFSDLPEADQKIWKTSSQIKGNLNTRRNTPQISAPYNVTQSERKYELDPATQLKTEKMVKPLPKRPDLISPELKKSAMDEFSRLELEGLTNDLNGEPSNDKLVSAFHPMAKVVQKPNPSKSDIEGAHKEFTEKLMKDADGKPRDRATLSNDEKKLLKIANQIKFEAQRGRSQNSATMAR